MSSSQLDLRPKTVQQPEVYLQLPLYDTETFYGRCDEWLFFRDMLTAVYLNIYTKVTLQHNIKTFINYH